MHVRVPRYTKWTVRLIAFRICYGQKLTVGQENRLFLCARIWVTSLWKALDAKQLTPGQLQAYPWKLWGITVQTSYVGGHQNCASQPNFPAIGPKLTELLYFVTPPLSRDKSWNKGLLRLAVTSRPSFAIHILNTLDMRIHQVPPSIYDTYSKNWANRDEATVFLDYFWWFLRLGARIITRNQRFSKLTVLGDFYALYHFVCHRYT